MAAKSAYNDFLSQVNLILNTQTLSETEKYDEVCSLVDKTRLLLKEAKVLTPIERLLNGPFGGLSYEDVDIQAKQKFGWYGDQINQLERDIVGIDKEIDSLKHRTDQTRDTVTATANRARIADLEADKLALETTRAHYQSKVSTREI